jgi:hypothetical protein
VSFLTLTLVIALTRTLITQVIADGPITLKTVATLGAAYAWPVLPVWPVLPPFSGSISCLACCWPWRCLPFSGVQHYRWSRH